MVDITCVGDGALLVFSFFKESTGARSPPEIFVFHQVATLFEQARCSLGEKHWGGGERERARA
jgi:hypothetical protein